MLPLWIKSKEKQCMEDLDYVISFTKDHWKRTRLFIKKQLNKWYLWGEKAERNILMISQNMALRLTEIFEIL